MPFRFAASEMSESLRYRSVSLTSATASSAFGLWIDPARPGQVVKLIASVGHANMTTKAASTAERIGIDIPTCSHSYRVGDVVAELRIPVAGISLRKTSDVHSELAKQLRRDLPFALRFKLVKW